MGSALARQLAKSHEVIIGSRDPAKAREAAKGIRGARGTDYQTASKEADSAVVSLPYSAIGALGGLSGALAGKLVVSVVNPLKFEDGLLHDSVEKGSAAQELARALPKSRVVTAFNNVPARFFTKDEVMPMDILVAAQSKEVFEEAAKLIRSIPNLRPLYAGPLSEAELVERVTALVLNLAKLNGTGVLTTRFVSAEG